MKRTKHRFRRQRQSIGGVLDYAKLAASPRSSTNVLVIHRDKSAPDSPVEVHTQSMELAPMTKYNRFHFGDVVVNRYASHSNPTKVGMVSHVDVSDKNAGPSLHLSDGKGRRWSYAGPDDGLEIVGRDCRIGSAREPDRDQRTRG